jgi:hypothetical protein
MNYASKLSECHLWQFCIVKCDVQEVLQRHTFFPVSIKQRKKVLINYYRILIGKPERKRPVGRTRCRTEDTNKINVMAVVFRGVDWIHLAHDWDWCWVLVNVAMNVYVPYNVGHLLTG